MVGSSEAALSQVGKVGKRGFPSLRRHSTGVHFYRENGKNVYLGKDPVAAQRQWLEKFGARLAPVTTPLLPPLPTDLQASQATPPQKAATPQRTVQDAAKRLKSILEGQTTPGPLQRSSKGQGGPRATVSPGQERLRGMVKGGRARSANGYRFAFSASRDEE